MFPDAVYWVSLLCGWNSFVLEGIGSYDWNGLEGNPKFNSPSFVQKILQSISYPGVLASMQLGVALKSFDGDGLFAAVDNIKVVIKQQTACLERGLKDRRSAGACTTSTVKAMKEICDTVMGDSHLEDTKSQKMGAVYIRTNRTTGNKFQVTCSTGKHTNAVLCCLSWFREKLQNYTEKRKLCLNEEEKLAFFNGMRNSVLDGSHRLEMIEFGQSACNFLSSDDPLVKEYHHTRNFADLVLCGLSKNQKRVNAVAENYRIKVTPIHSGKPTKN